MDRPAAPCFFRSVLASQRLTLRPVASPARPARDMCAAPYGWGAGSRND